MTRSSLDGHEWGALAVEVTASLVAMSLAAVEDAGLEPPPTITGRGQASVADAPGGTVNWSLLSLGPAPSSRNEPPGSIGTVELDLTFLLTATQPADGLIDAQAITAFGAVLGRVHESPVRRVLSTTLGGPLRLHLLPQPLPPEGLHAGVRSSGGPGSPAAVVAVRATPDDTPSAGGAGPGLELVVVRGGSPIARRRMAEKAAATDLVHLGRVDSRHIEETEKQLSETFARAAESGAALLFDEADALFAARSGIADPGDRYAWLGAALPESGTVVITTADDKLASYLAEQGATVLDAD